MIDNYNKLTLGQYQEILAIQNNESLEDLDKQVGTLSILSGKTEDELLHLPIGEYKEMAQKAMFLEVAEVTPHPLAKKYQVGNYELCPVTDYRKLETGQYIDFNTYANDMDKNMVELLSVILVPKGHRYNDGYDILDVQQALRDEMYVSEGAVIVGFFLTLCKRSIRDSLNYSKREAKGIKDKKKREELLARIREQEKVLTESGDGLRM